MVFLAVLKWTERLGARRECTKDGWPTLLKSIHNRTVDSLDKACSRSLVHSEALSQLPERGLVIRQITRADVTVLKFIWAFCGYRERRQVALRIQKCNVPGCVPPQPSALFWLFLCFVLCPPSAPCSVLAVFVFRALSPLSLPAKLRFFVPPLPSYVFLCLPALCYVFSKV